jgi:hypothetical protein
MHITVKLSWNSVQANIKACRRIDTEHSEHVTAEELALTERQSAPLKS